jgi:G3E family GTPase
MKPPDPLVSAVVDWNGGDEGDWDRFVKTIPQGILRAKGFIRIGDQVRLFDWVRGTVNLDDVPEKIVPSDRLGRLVFIGPVEVVARLRPAMGIQAFPRFL